MVEPSLLRGVEDEGIDRIGTSAVDGEGREISVVLSLTNHCLCSDPRAGCGAAGPPLERLPAPRRRGQEQSSGVLIKQRFALLTYGCRRFFFVGYIFFHLPCFRDCYGLFLILLTALKCLAIRDHSLYIKRTELDQP